MAEPGADRLGRLRGVSPPFTPTGRAAMLRSRTGRYAIGRPTIGAHSGMLLRWRADANAIAALVPAPLVVPPGSDLVTCFLNVTQTGLNLFRPQDDTTNAALRAIDPLHVNWYEAIFFLDCAFEGRRTRYTFVIYKDVDHGVLLGIANGYHTKLARFHVRYPLGAHAQRDMRPGAAVRMTASRFDELVVDATFRCDREVPAEEVRSGVSAFWLASTAGVRYLADGLDLRARPLVHDIVLREQRTPDMPGDAPAAITRAWAGSAQVVIGTSEREGLSALAPLELLDAYFIHLPTLSGPRTGTGVAMTRVLYDYVGRGR